MSEDYDIPMRSPTLRGCDLPTGFTLLTPMPRQFWLDSQMRWGFKLQYRKDGDCCTHVALYHQAIPDDVQMKWALEDFVGALMAEGVHVSKHVQEYLPIPKTSVLRNIPTSDAHRMVM